MDVAHVAQLANLPLTKSEKKKFSSQFADTLKMVDLINELDTSNVPASTQVTGLENIARKDVIEPSRVLSQSSALSTASHTYNGYFVVPAILHDQ